jgi:hypothetical protein
VKKVKKLYKNKSKKAGYVNFATFEEILDEDVTI